MLFIGIFLMILASFYAWKEYVSYLGRESRELSEIISFVKMMRERMSCYLEPVSSWIGSYSTPELERVGLIEGIRRSKDVLTAFKDAEREMCIGDEAKAALNAMLCEMGDGYLDTELATVDIALEKLGIIEKRVIGDYKNKTRAAGAMLAAVTVGVVILVI